MILVFRNIRPVITRSKRFVLGLSCKLFDFLWFELRINGLQLIFCFFVSTQTHSEKSTQHCILMVIITGIMVRRSSYLILQSTASVDTSWCIVIASACHGLLASFLLIGKEHFPQVQVQFSSVAQSCPILCDPMNHRTPGLPVHHQLPEFTQTHVHRVGDAIQPSHPL